MLWTSRLWGLAQRSAATLLELVYPSACSGCGRRGLGLWCSACDAGVRWLHGAAAIRSIDPPDNADMRVYSCGVFEDALRSAVHSLKFNACPQMAIELAPHLAALWREHSVDAQCILAIPLHASRQRERGYNQSELLASALADIVGAPFERRALRRTRATQQQAMLSQAERAANVAGAFVADRLLIAGRRVLIIDDVFTTGATLAAAAAACHAAGAASVAAMTVARAD